jgi:hypothetical protein
MNSSFWNWFYTGSLEDVTAANSQIDDNCGFPNGDTQTWSVPQQAYEQDFWFILQPPPEGYKDKIGYWTQEQMISGVENVELQQSNSSWWPNPFPPGGQ